MLASKQATVFPSLQRQQQRRQRQRLRAATPLAPSQRTNQPPRSRSDGFKLAASIDDDVSQTSTTTISSPSPSSSSSSTTTTTAAIAATKAALRQASPAARKGDPEAIAAVVAAVEKLSSLALEQQQEREASSSSSSSSPPLPLPPLFPPPPEPSTWETLYTDAKVGSNGKFGPLQGEARQLFVASAKLKTTTTSTSSGGGSGGGGGGRFINRVAFPSVRFPLLQADFSGSWLPKPNRRDRVEVVFEDNSFSVLGGVRVGGGEFPPPPAKGSVKGHWVMKYADDDVRAFVTNKMSLVVLGRVKSEEK